MNESRQPSKAEMLEYVLNAQLLSALANTIGHGPNDLVKNKASKRVFWISTVQAPMDAGWQTGIFEKRGLLWRRNPIKYPVFRISEENFVSNAVHHHFAAIGMAVEFAPHFWPGGMTYEQPQEESWAVSFAAVDSALKLGGENIDLPDFYGALRRKYDCSRL